jgi:hypothetical protein
MLLISAANFCCQLGMQLSWDSNLWLLLSSQVLVFISPVLEMHNSWKEIHISKMIFKNPELDFKNEIIKIKIREI